MFSSRVPCSPLCVLMFFCVLCIERRTVADPSSCEVSSRLTVLWGEVVGCLVLGSIPECQITIQSTVFPEVAVISSMEDQDLPSGGEK